MVASLSAPNDAETTSAHDRVIGRSEWDIEAMVARVVRTVDELRSGLEFDEVVAVGVTGQQQGCQLLEGDGSPIGPFIAWQDQRCKDAVDGTSVVIFLGLPWHRKVMRHGVVQGLPSFRDAGCPIVTGYTAPTLFWLDYMGMMPAKAEAAITAPEYLAHKLVGSRRPVTDATDAAGWGVLNVPQARAGTTS